MPRHAKAGNLNNALLATEGEFLLILDADQVPQPEILDRTLGYFRDERMALVQTPQWFVNVPDDDPLGSQAPLFYGPIQQGKDGWNAAFFCGSNAVLRREALMQLGVSRYAGEVEVGVQPRAAHAPARSSARRARTWRPTRSRCARRSTRSTTTSPGPARELDRGEALFDVTYRFQQRVAAIRRELVARRPRARSTSDLADRSPALERLADDPDLSLADDRRVGAARQLADREWSPLGASRPCEALVRSIDVDRGGEAQPVMPMATISVTEDMATCMRLHGLGWRSAYHDEMLAAGPRARGPRRPCSPSGCAGRRARCR